MSSFRPSGFGNITPMVKNLLIINAVIFVLMILVEPIGNILFTYGALHFPGSKYFVFTQFITYMFLHAGFFHILFNMFGLWMFGTAIERVWGWKRFLNFYLACGLGAAVTHILVMYLQYHEAIIIPGNRDLIPPTVGASGAIYGLLVAFGYLYPNNKILIYFLFPIKAKYFVVLLIAIDLFSGFSNSGQSNIAHFAHVGGAVTGLIICFAGNLRRFIK